MNKSTLYKHDIHLHLPKNVNATASKEQQGVNARIAVFLTHVVGSMPAAYLFVVIALVGLLAILGVLTPLTALLVAWASQTLIQLVLLPVIMVGQNVLSRHSELQAEETFETTQKSFHDIEQIMNHLDAQDAKILEILEKTGNDKDPATIIQRLDQQDEVMQNLLQHIEKMIKTIEERSGGY